MQSYIHVSIHINCLKNTNNPHIKWCQSLSITHTHYTHTHTHTHTHTQAGWLRVRESKNGEVVGEEDRFDLRLWRLLPRRFFFFAAVAPAYADFLSLFLSRSPKLVHMYTGICVHIYIYTHTHIYIIIIITFFLFKNIIMCLSDKPDRFSLTRGISDAVDEQNVVTFKWV
jgi:hypothetical protein